MSWLIPKLHTTYPDISFVEAAQFSWHPATHTVYYNSKQAHAPLLLLHELSHALLDHQEYQRDIQLIAMETAAWERAKDYSKEYDIAIDEAVVQDHLDTYREWLHARSRCPNCSANGYQIDARHYECPACAHRWKVNEARLCALRRYSVTET